MRFYTKQHKFYCGIDLHARTMYVWVLHQEGEIMFHRNMKASPETFLKAIAPYRERYRHGCRMPVSLGTGSPTCVLKKGSLLSSGMLSL